MHHTGTHGRSAHLRLVPHGIASVCDLPVEIDLGHHRRAAAFGFA